MKEIKFLKRGHHAKTRLLFWENQNKICPLCEKEISLSDAALDHDHDSGQIRAVLHDVCNRALGFIETSIKKSEDGDRFYSNILEYLKHHSENGSGLIHPRHEGLQRVRQKNEVKLPRFEITAEEKLKYLAAIEEGPLPHPSPKKNTNPIGSWKRTAEKYGINHGRLLAYVIGNRNKDELKEEVV